MERADVAERSGCGRPSRLTQFTLVNPSGARVNEGVRCGWEERREGGEEKGHGKRRREIGGSSFE